jgi:hypothetical protein
MANLLQELCDREGVTMDVTRLPSVWEGRTGFLRFFCVLKRGGATLEVPSYQMGEGHIVVPDSVGPRRSVDGAAYVAAILAKPNGVRVGGSVIGSLHVGPLPSVADVVASLVFDADCWESSRDIEDFAANYGGEIKSLADAKRIEASYLACAETAKRLRAFLGGKLAEFQEAARDY